MDISERIFAHASHAEYMAFRNACKPSSIAVNRVNLHTGPDLAVFKLCMLFFILLLLLLLLLLFTFSCFLHFSSLYFVAYCQGLQPAIEIK